MHAWRCLGSKVLLTSMPVRVQSAMAFSYVPMLRRLYLSVTSKSAADDYEEAPVIKGMLRMSQDIMIQSMQVAFWQSAGMASVTFVWFPAVENSCSP